MSKEEIDTSLIISKELRNALDSLMKTLEENGWELNDDGDIVDKKTKRLVWEIAHGIKED